ncbi:uncharacterized protein [Montipora capricornis]|uniref:uncharacterized protein n=1 Tax=Montipora capricornis TaxID=246305 RepID=UPI0035F19D4C
MIKADDVSWARYRSSRNILNVALRKVKSAFYASQIENVTGNPKKAWKTVNDILGRKQRTDDVREIKINDHSVTSPEQIAEKFNDYFASIGPSLAENIDNNECNYSQFVNRVDGSFHFQPIFDGNNDQNTAKKNVVSNVLITRWLRFVVKESRIVPCMRTEVYGVKQKPENIVAGKSTTQSSIYSDDYSNGTSDKAVDGNPDQEFKNAHYSRTLEDDPSWWRVDLSSPVQVFEVRIITGNSPSSDGSNVTRNQVYNITLGDSFNVTNNPVCARWNGSFELEASLVCHMNPPRSGRYVGILTSRKKFLQLCEVEIFSKGNLAFRKPVIPSEYGADYVVDGNLETRSLYLLFWQVDLGRMVPVKEVHYYTRYGYYFVVRVGDNEKEEIHLHCDRSFHERFKQRDVNFLFSCKPW